MDRQQSAAAREGPRAAKETRCVRPYLALQAPSLAARKRCYYKKACVEAGPTQGRRRYGLYPSQAGNHEWPRLIAPDLFALSQEQVRQALTGGNPVRMSQESAGDASPPEDESDVTDLMSTHVFRKPNARTVYLRNMVLLETEYQDILRYVLMILASVDKIVSCLQENLSALHEVISGLSLGPAEYDLHHRNRGYGRDLS